MSKRAWVFWLAVVGAGIAAQVMAQQPGQGVFIASPTGAEQVEIVGVGPLHSWARVTQLRDAHGYSKQVPTSGASVPVPANVSRLILIPAGTLSTLTIVTPASPFDGATFCVFSTQSVTTLTMTASTGQTLNGGLTSITANAAAPCWTYSSANTTWDRSE